MTAISVEERGSRPGPESCSVLLVEDNPGDARLIEVHLGQTGLEVELACVGSLEEARAVFGEDRMDLCFLDLGLPDSEGAGTVERFRAFAGEVPVVVLTGQGESAWVAAAARAGAEEYLVKDELTPGALERTIRLVLEREGRRRTRREAEEWWTQLFALSPVPKVVSDAETGRLIEVNDAYLETFGLRREEVIGRTAAELGPWVRPDRRKKLLRQLRAEGFLSGGEVTVETRDGRSRQVLVSCRRLETAAGGQFLWNIQDITERVAHERALAERVKEQSCLYDVSRILHEADRPLKERLQAVVDRIPAGWQYPEMTAARLRLSGESYVTGDFTGAVDRLEVELEVDGEEAGDLAVGYTEARPEEVLGPFLLEEQRLLEELASQVETEVSRQRTRRRMRRVVETMTEAVTIAAPDGTIVYANTAARQLFDDPEKGYIGEDLTDFAPSVRRLNGDPFPPEEMPFQTVMRTGEPVTGVEHLIERVDGEPIAVSVNAAPIRGEEEEEEEIKGVVLTVRDVTDRHREAEWRHLLEASVEAAAHGILVTDRQGEIVWTNSAFTEMTGYRREEAVGETPILLRSGEHDEAFYEELWATILAGETWEGELVNRRKDGTLYTERQSIVPVRHRTDEITHFIAIKEDITDRKEREARYRTLVETMAEATVILDEDGQISFANAEAEEVLGLEESEIRSRAYDDPAWTIEAPDGGPFSTAELPFRRVMETGEPVRNVEHAIVRPDGSRTVLSVNAAPMKAGRAGPKRVVATMRDVTEQRRLEARLEHQALHDPLTGLANRTLLEDRLDQALARSRRRGEAMGLLMVDIDGFKRINDHLGHTVGDLVLERIARRLEATVRETDTVARWGGDEFVVVLPGIERSEMIESLQARLREGLQAPIPANGEELEVDVTIGGVVQLEGDASRTVETRNPEDLVRFADLALHRAKSRSQGGFHLFDPTEKLDEIPDLRLEQDLRRGIEAGEIEVFYQPIYRLEDEELWGLEALARWRHPEKGLVAPGGFIPLAERVGLIRELGDTVCRQSCEQLAAWIGGGKAPSDLKLAINLSARQLQYPGLTDRMRERIEENGLSPDQIVVEVTETVMMKTVGQAREFGAMGVDLFIDDFGTGYSTFTYLRELDVDGLKIDRSLLEGLPDSTSDVAIVESILTLADRLGMEVVSEGIETEDQLRVLRGLGAGLGQGFLLGRPAPADQIEGLLTS